MSDGTPRTSATSRARPKWLVGTPARVGDVPMRSSAGSTTAASPAPSGRRPDYEADDLGPSRSARLIAAGAKPDKALLWDLASPTSPTPPTSCTTSTTRRRRTTATSPSGSTRRGSSDADKAVAAAAEVIGDVRRANVAIAFAWTPQRAAVLEALVAQRLSGRAVRRPRRAARERRRSVADEGDGRAPHGAAQGRPRERGSRGPGVPARRRPRRGDASAPVELRHRVRAVRRPWPGADACRSRRTPRPARSTAAVERARCAREARAAPTMRSRPSTSRATCPPNAPSCRRTRSSRTSGRATTRSGRTTRPRSPTVSAGSTSPSGCTTRRKDIASFAGRTRKAVEAKHIVLLGMGGSSLGAETFARMLSPRAPVDRARHDASRSRRRGHVVARPRAHDLRRRLEVGDDDRDARASRVLLVADRRHGGGALRRDHRSGQRAREARDRAQLRPRLREPAGHRRPVFGAVVLRSRPGGARRRGRRAGLTSARRAMVANAPGRRCVGRAGRAARRRDRRVCAQGRARQAHARRRPVRCARSAPWIEQLIAESTGKDGKGILPVVGEPLGAPDVYGDDRLFVVYTIGATRSCRRSSRRSRSIPIVRIRVDDVRRVGAEMFRWELATAIVGYLLDINPFDQPDVEAAKVRAREALRGVIGPDAGDATRAARRRRAAALHRDPGVPRRRPTRSSKRLEAVRVKLRDALPRRRHDGLRPPVPALDRAVPQGGPGHGRLPPGNGHAVHRHRRPGHGLLVRQAHRAPRPTATCWRSAISDAMPRA